MINVKRQIKIYKLSNRIYKITMDNDLNISSFITNLNNDLYIKEVNNKINLYYYSKDVPNDRIILINLLKIMLYKNNVGILSINYNVINYIPIMDDWAMESISTVFHANTAMDILLCPGSLSNKLLDKYIRYAVLYDNIINYKTYLEQEKTKCEKEISYAIKCILIDHSYYYPHYYNTIFFSDDINEILNILHKSYYNFTIYVNRREIECNFNSSYFNDTFHRLALPGGINGFL